MAWDDPYDSGLISSIDPRIQSNPFIDEAAGLRIQNQYLDQQRRQQGGGQEQSGKGSWYSQLPEHGWIDRQDKPGSNALGVPDSQQGIALPSKSTLGQWFDVTAPNGETFRLQQTDVGPSTRTGRGIDISAAAAHQMGYTPKDFPTDGGFSWKPANGPPSGAEAAATGSPPDTRNYGSVAAAPYGRPNMNDDNQAQPPGLMQSLFGGLFGGGQQQQGGGGLIGAIDPQKMAYLGMIAKGLDPYSTIDPTAMLKNAQLQQQHQQDLALKQRAQTFDEGQTGVTNAFREKQLAQQGETDASRAAKDNNLKPGTSEYQDFIRKWYLSKQGETWKPVTIEGPNGEKQTVFQNPQGEVRRPEQMPGYTPSTDTGGNPYSASGKMTTDEGKAALFADRAANAHADITKYENINNQPGGTVGALIQQNLPAGAANAVVSGARGQAMDAQRSFINALLRRESGAAISAGEYDSYGKEYFPQYGDTKDQIDAKRTRRASVIAGLAREGGRGYRPSYSFDESGNITLGKPSYTGKGQSAAPMEGAKQAKDGNWYVQQNGKYFRVDQ